MLGVASRYARCIAGHSKRICSARAGAPKHAGRKEKPGKAAAFEVRESIKRANAAMFYKQVLFVVLAFTAMLLPPWLSAFDL